MIYYLWQFGQRGRTKGAIAWKDHIDKHNTLEEALKSTELHADCEYCLAHRLVRVEEVAPNKGYITPVLYSVNSKLR
jgi:hypothetical protein